MRSSRPFTRAGRFLGVVATRESGVIFIAIDPRLDDLNGMTFSSAAEAEHIAALVLAERKPASEARP